MQYVSPKQLVILTTQTCTWSFYTWWKMGNSLATTTQNYRKIRFVVSFMDVTYVKFPIFINIIRHLLCIAMVRMHKNPSATTTRCYVLSTTCLIHVCIHNTPTASLFKNAEFLSWCIRMIYVVNQAKRLWEPPTASPLLLLFFTISSG